MRQRKVVPLIAFHETWLLKGFRKENRVLSHCLY